MNKIRGLKYNHKWLFGIGLIFFAFYFLYETWAKGTFKVNYGKSLSQKYLYKVSDSLNCDFCLTARNRYDLEGLSIKINDTNSSSIIEYKYPLKRIIDEQVDIHECFIINNTEFALIGFDVYTTRSAGRYSLFVPTSCLFDTLPQNCVQ